MKIYAISDIHGYFEAFEEALKLVDLSGNNKLILLGDYVHGGKENYEVLNKIIQLQQKYGTEKVVALMGNHENFVISGQSSIQSMFGVGIGDCDDTYIHFMENLPFYHVEKNVIFVHAGINEEAGEEGWEWESNELEFLGKYPAQTGVFDGNMIIVAGHVGTEGISGDPRFNDIYYDGASHYYIDFSVGDSGYLNVLMYDTQKDVFYQMYDGGQFEIEPYSDY